MTAVAQLLREATARIPAAESRWLLAHTLDLPVSRVFTHPALTPEQRDRFEALVTERAAGTPLQYLIGSAPFRNVQVAVGPGVFIPRPETEVMTGWALDRLRQARPAPVVVELCAGSGAISLAIADEFTGAEQYAVELSDDAIRYASRNLAGTGVALAHADMADALCELNGTVDLVIANPPYVPLESFDGIPAEVRDHEPALALFSGPDGLDAMRVLARVAARLLRPGGWVCAEHAELQHAGAPAVFVRHGGFDQVHDRVDLNDRPRFVTARRVAAVAGWPS